MPNRDGGKIREAPRGAGRCCSRYVPYLIQQGGHLRLRSLPRDPLRCNTEVATKIGASNVTALLTAIASNRRRRGPSAHEAARWIHAVADEGGGGDLREVEDGLGRRAAASGRENGEGRAERGRPEIAVDDRVRTSVFQERGQGLDRERMKMTVAAS